MREQKKRLARAALERAALLLFEERGFDATTIKDIAEAAGMSPRTFFRYFASKEDVVFSRTGEEFGFLRGLVMAEPRDQTAFETMKSALMKFAEHFQSQPPEDIQLRAKLLAMSASLRRRAAEELEALSEELAKDLADRENTKVAPRHHLVAKVTLQAMVVAGTTWGETGSTYPQRLSEMFEELEDAVLQVGAKSPR